MENQYRYGYNFNEPYNPYPSYDPQSYYSNREDFNNQEDFQDYPSYNPHPYYSNQGNFSNYFGDHSYEGGYNQDQDQGDFDQDCYYQSQEQGSYQTQNDSPQEESNMMTIMNMLKSITQTLEKSSQELQEIKARNKRMETQLAQQSLPRETIIDPSRMQDEVLDEEIEQDEITPLELLNVFDSNDEDTHAVIIDQVEETAQEISTPQIREVNSTQNTLIQFENDVLNCDDDFPCESLMCFDEESVGDFYHEPNELCAQ